MPLSAFPSAGFVLSCDPVNPTDASASKPAIAIIPARYLSTRLPGKPLLEIAGRPMILHVAERAQSATNVARVIVATDDQRIFDVVRQAGFEARLTRADHRSGSDRLAEVAAELADEFQLIVNVQGDEPFISPRVIEQAVNALLNDPQAAVATTCELIDNAADALNPDLVKVVTNEQGRALYFSRSPVPYPRDAARRHGSLAAALKHEPELLTSFRKHTGLYVYRRHFLLDYACWPQSKLERAEALEQLRILERGHQIRVVEVAESSLGIDTPEDLEWARKIFGEVRGSSPANLTGL